MPCRGSKDGNRDRGSNSWMYRIAQNIWLDRMRANKVRGEVVDVDVVEELPGLDGRDVTESQLTLEEVDAALGSPAELNREQ